jgi:hypothetical protein
VSGGGDPHAEWRTSSAGLSWILSCQPASEPSGWVTRAVICKPRSVARLVPRMTVMRAARAAVSTAAHARSRKAGAGGGGVVPVQR